MSAQGDPDPLPRGLPASQLLPWLLGRRRRFAIRGASMEPTLRDGDEVLVDLRAYRRAGPATGDLVLVRHPFQTDLKIVKRVEAVLADGRLVLRGDNPGESTDSRSYGAVAPDRALGRVVLVLP